MNWFNKQSRLVQILLLLIPVVNEITELIVRWDCALKKPTLLHILIAVLMIFIGIPFGWVDLIWCLLFKHLVFAK
jgi:hypothetical protein